MTTKYQYQSDFARKYVAEGRAEGRSEGRAEGRSEGEASALLTVLAARGIDVPAGARDRITGCSDLEQLAVWLCLAATATSIDDVLR